MKVVHLQSRGKHEQDAHPKREEIAKRVGENPSYTHCEKEGHDDKHCWKLNPELRPKRNGRKEKQKITTMKQYQESKSEYRYAM